MRSSLFSRITLSLVPAVFLVVVGLLLSWDGGDVGAALDSDGDGYDDALEGFLGTDPFDDCSIGPDVGPSPAWPPDVDGSTTLPNSVDTISITDFTSFLSGPPPNLGDRTGDGNYAVRWDLNADGLIGILDLVQLSPPMFGSTCPNPYVPPTAVGSIAEIAIDMDTAGNDARLTLGANVQECGEINSGGTNTIEIDVLIPSPGIDALDGIEAWEFLLNYDPAVVSVTAEDVNFLLAQATGSLLNTSTLSDPLPDTSGSWRSGGGDFGTPVDPEPTGAHEVGRGVLTRITLTGVAPGTSALTLTKAGAMTGANGNIPVLSVTDATVSVDETCVPITGGADSDGDGIPDTSDNCPSTPNPNQENDVHPGTNAGDHCEDPEPDGVFDIDDNCPDTVNPNQENNVHPGTAAGDHCEDPEPDGVFDIDDNCPDVANAGQEDNDGDLVGDVCDPDDDNDGVCDGAGSAPDGTPGTIAGGCSAGPDNCPVDYNPDQTDDDSDNVGNICDPNTDSDGDGIPNDTDNCPTVFNPDQADADGDSAGDVCDEDKDGDLIANGAADPDGAGPILAGPDNCPLTPNGPNEAAVPNVGNQTDTDGDGLGDACDPFPGDADEDDDLIADGDADPDGAGPIEAGPDNCPSTPNGPNEAAVPNVGNQTDTDGDGLGDACDPFPTVADGDYDGIPDPEDNCPSNYNAKQIDVDGDGDGDACDADIDDDGVANASDNCPRDANAGQADGDSDGLGDACDPNPGSTDSDGDGIDDGVDPFPGDADGDGDGTDDPLDNCPVVPNVDQFDSDFDDLGDACDPDDGDPDIDGDGVDDGLDNCPLVANGAAEAGTVGNQVDADGDGLGNVCDPNDADRDSDNDEVIDSADNCKLAYNAFQNDIDGDGLGDACDVDPDGDGVNSAAGDNCLFVANAGQADGDGDGIGDKCDPFPTAKDSDEDGFPDPIDNCPGIANESQLDSDRDRLGDVCDGPDGLFANNPDRDDDDVIDGLDNCVATANTDQTDTDNDALGDACDPDDDEDGVCDSGGPLPDGTPGTPSGGCVVGAGGADNCRLAANPGQADNDGDGDGDACDGDDDNDGLLDTVEDVCGSDKFDAGSIPERIDGGFAAADEDGNDGNDEALPGGAEVADCDGDGYTGDAEDHVYSYIGQLDGDQKTCQEYDTNFSSVDPNQTAATPSLRWPSDFNSVASPLDSFNRLNILDLTSFLAPVKYFGTNLGTNPGDVRWDLTPGKGVFATDINVQDITAMIAGSSGVPPMLGGAKALFGPVCPWAP